MGTTDLSNLIYPILLKKQVFLLQAELFLLWAICFLMTYPQARLRCITSFSCLFVGGNNH